LQYIPKDQNDLQKYTAKDIKIKFYRF
jgi:hypothetical protein